jgi:hypothetical protein
VLALRIPFVGPTLPPRNFVVLERSGDLPRPAPNFVRSVTDPAAAPAVSEASAPSRAGDMGVAASWHRAQLRLAPVSFLAMTVAAMLNRNTRHQSSGDWFVFQFEGVIGRLGRIASAWGAAGISGPAIGLGSASGDQLLTVPAGSFASVQPFDGGHASPPALDAAAAHSASRVAWHAVGASQLASDELRR